VVCARGQFPITSQELNAKYPLKLRQGAEGGGDACCMPMNAAAKLLTKRALLPVEDLETITCATVSPAHSHETKFQSVLSPCAYVAS